MPTHAELLARHRQVLPDWMILYYREPIAIVDGEGRHVTDAEGNRYLDFFGGILVTMSGHRIPQVVEAIKTQADRLLHSSTLYLIESQIALAERIAALSGIPTAKAFFTNSRVEPGDRVPRQLPRSVPLHGRRDRAAGLVGDGAEPVPDHIRPWSVPVAQPVRPSPGRGVHGRVRARPRGHADGRHRRAGRRDD